MSIEANEFEAINKPFSLNSLIQEVLSLIMMQANRKQLVINLEKEVQLPDIINSDERRLQQILLNLLINAVKYTPSQKRITIRVARDSRDDEMLNLHVADQGIGMSLEERLQLFKLFGGGLARSSVRERKKRGSPHVDPV